MPAATPHQVQSEMRDLINDMRERASQARADGEPTIAVTYETCAVMVDMKLNALGLHSPATLDAQVVDVVDTAPSLPAGFNFNSSL
ncbi:MAG: hypothetical protein GY774_34910 [Planctomycetes bacterium]|nr:hypothetical protein [Planctomycetota bacterium]